MSSYMPVYMTAVTRLVGAMWTRKWFFPCMYSKMYFQVKFLFTFV